MKQFQSWVYICKNKQKKDQCKDIYTPVFIAALFIKYAKIWRKPKCP